MKSMVAFFDGELSDAPYVLAGLKTGCLFRITPPRKGLAADPPHPAGCSVEGNPDDHGTYVFLAPRSSDGRGLRRPSRDSSRHGGGRRRRGRRQLELRRIEQQRRRRRVDHHPPR
jgi:hypothetical protein